MTLFDWLGLWLATVLAYTGAWMALLPVPYITASLAAIFIMPLMLKQLAENEYRMLRRWVKIVLSLLRNSVLATILFIAGWLLTLPLWIIPGLSLILPCC